MPRLYLVLTKAESDALLRLAQANLRTTREQIRWLLRRELKRRKRLSRLAKRRNSRKETAHVS